MPRPLSNDLRERIVRSVEGGKSCRGEAEHYDVSVSAVIRLMQRWKATGDYRPKRMGGYLNHKLAAHKDVVDKLLAEKNDMTLMEMKERLSAAKIKVSHMSIFRFLEHLGLSYKKNCARQRAGKA